MIQALIRTLLHANHFMFLVGVCALFIAVSGLLLSLVIAIFPIFRRLQRTEEATDQRESLGSFAQWAARCFARMTAVQTIWSIIAYAGFCVLNLPQGKSRLFIIGANLICSVSAFAESMRRMVKKERDGVEKAGSNPNILTSNPRLNRESDRSRQRPD